MKHNTDTVIIGGGPIGIFAAFETGMLDMSCHIIEMQSLVGGQCRYLYPEKPIYDIPGYPVISGEELVNKLKMQAAPFKPRYHCGRLASCIKKLKNKKFIVALDNGEEIECYAVIIAGGCGVFEHNKPMVENIEQFEKKHVHYIIDNKDIFSGKNILIAGGGDSAVDWAIVLADIAKKVYVVHRRNKFRCHPRSEKILYDLARKGLIEMLIPYQLFSLSGEGEILQKVILKTLSGDQLKELQIDDLLIFFGLKSSLGPILDWGFVIENKKIIVNNENFCSNQEGIYAVGDIADYPGKLKLIVTGFAEVAAACHHIRKNVFSDKVFNFEYSTNKF